MSEAKKPKGELLEMINTCHKDLYHEHLSLNPRSQALNLNCTLGPIPPTSLNPKPKLLFA